ncbi:MAG: 2,4-dichlorophenol 6-monooxygenase, partial [Solirubrobacteraceae bacterium]|nr:2,4-dichlorophenol 6-monooxygenase [Solirubrobacteraceae bacterium]
MSDVTTPVLVVGAGPAGLATSLSLSRLGVPHLLVEKHPGTAHSPRAHIVNQRTVEICRDLGIEDRLLDVATPAELMSNNVWATSLAGRELARLQTWGTSAERAADYRAASPSPMCNCPQHVLGPVLREAIEEAGVGEIRFRHELLSLAQDAEGVTATVRDRDGERDITVRAQYVVGADGGRSRVVELAGLPLEGEHGLAQAANVWFEADLTRFCAHRPGVLYWNASPGKDYWVGAGTFICVKPWTEWVMLFMFDPSVETVDPEDLDALRARVHKVIGDESVEVDVKSLSFWTINHVLAERYTEGRVLCMGDAVHRHPPANGLGLNTSMADGFNLAWKLAYVLDGRADPSLLDTYDAERRPVGRITVDRAMKSVVEMAAIPAALGFRPDQSEEEGWASLERLWEEGPEGDATRTAFREAIELTNYQYNAHGVELGYVYREGAVVPDGRPEPPHERDAELYYRPTTTPGARLPHAWLDDGSSRLS